MKAWQTSVALSLYAEGITIERSSPERDGERQKRVLGIPVSPSHYGLLDIPAPGEMSALSSVFCPPGRSPCLMEKKKWPGEAMSAPEFKTIHAVLSWVSLLSRKCSFLTRSKRRQEANLARLSAKLWVWAFSLFRCET